MLQKIKEIIEKSNPDYIVEYEESSLMNVKADEIKRDKSFAYIEEFRRGKFTEGKFGGRKQVMRMQIYFCKFSELQNDAIEREIQRENIISEIVRPFISEYEKSGHFDDVKEWPFYYPLPRFDANEVSVMLEFDCSIQIC